MAQITQAERELRIKQLLTELNKIPPERHEVMRLPWTAGEPLLRPVIKVSVDEILLNHRSHRVRAQLEDDPEWDELRKDPHSEAAQWLVERHVRAARTQDEFAALKESLQREGQTHPGVMTHKGVLVNANTRAVALRELEDPAARYIRVAVLPETAQAEELALLELRLQMQKELKVDYSLTNELLFIEELSSERGLSDAQIAAELRIYPESVQKGKAEVQVRLRMLDLVRQMQRIPAERLPLTFFDSLGYQQLRELDRTYQQLLQQDPSDAQQHIESFLLSVAVGVTPVHQVRKIDATFMKDYMMPQLQEDEAIGTVADNLVSAAVGNHPAEPKGVTDLLAGGDEPGDAPISVRRLIDIVTSKDKRVDVPDSDFVVDQEDVKQAVKGAIITGVREKKRDESAQDKLEAPIEAVKSANVQLARTIEMVRAIQADEDFDVRRRRSLEAAYKRLRRTLKDLEVTLTKADVLTR